jgi:Ca-activated chloride channel family protein
VFKQVVIYLLFTAALFGGVLDFRTLDKAKEAYANGQYKEAASLYESLGDKNDDLHFNLGDAYYKEQKYDAALKQYEQVKTEALRAKALHNIGNAYAKLNKTDEAIGAYEAALKLSDDEDTKYNLELLKKKKEQQQKKEQNKEQQQNRKNDQNQKNDQKKQNEQQKGQKDQENKNGQQNQQQQNQKPDQKSEEKKQENQQKGQNEQQKQDEEAKKEEQAKREQQERQAKEEEASKKEKSEKEQQAMEQKESQEKPISDMQQRKYEKMLDKRGIRTLMVPLKTEGAKDEETTAW